MAQSSFERKHTSCVACKPGSHHSFNCEKFVKPVVNCNMCGNDCVRHFGNVYGLQAQATGGYDSTHLEDHTDYTFAMCESCLTKLFKLFIVPVAKNER